jgi:hypothetical protein
VEKVRKIWKENVENAIGHLNKLNNYKLNTFSGLKNEEVIKHQESIIADMERIVSDFDQNQTFNESTLMDLVKRITNYFNPVVNE